MTINVTLLLGSHFPQSVAYPTGLQPFWYTVIDLQSSNLDKNLVSKLQYKRATGMLYSAKYFIFSTTMQCRTRLGGWAMTINIYNGLLCMVFKALVRWSVHPCNESWIETSARMHLKSKKSRSLMLVKGDTSEKFTFRAQGERIYTAYPRKPHQMPWEMVR